LKSYIEAHITVCYAAYAIVYLFGFRISKLSVSAIDALDLLKTGYRVKLLDTKSKFEWEA